MPFLFWAIRFGMFGASGAITIISFLAVQAALNGRGLLPSLSCRHRAGVATFPAVAGAALYVVAILIRRNKGVERFLRESESRFRSPGGHGGSDDLDVGARTRSALF